MAKGTTKPIGRAVAAAIAAGAAGAAGVMSARAYRAGQGAPVGDYGAASSAVDGDVRGAGRAQGAADRLSELIKYRTVFSSARDKIELEEFSGFIDALGRLYPGVHAALDRELVNGHGLLFKWDGGSANHAEKPVVLMAHYDVVPVDDQDPWTHPPFSGHQSEGYVWGRGALDDKGSLVLIMDAVESLLSEGFRPPCDVYLSFGNNEETAGDTAAAAVALLANRGVRPWMVLDEGGAVALEAFPGLSAPAAVIGVSEKGIMDLELLTRSSGGHASTPPRMGATARLSKAIMALETTPFPAHMPEPIEEMMRRIGTRSSFGLRLVTENLWAFKPMLTRVFGWVGDETRALTRTTVAITMLEGSKANNVLASTARANANIRIAVGESSDSVLAMVRRIIDDPLVELTVKESHEPSPISPFDGEQFELLSKAVAASYPDALVTPYIQTGATDARNFTAISPAVYRFSPLLMDAGDRASVHAVNERVRISTLGSGVEFYRELLQRLNG